MEDGPERRIATFDGWELLREPLELRREGQTVHLQEMPLQILQALTQRPGVLVTREELIARLWPKGVVDFDAGLNTATRKLRVALGDDAEAPRYIETVPRQGYRFVGQLTDPPPPSTPAASAPRRLRLGWLALALGLVMAAVAAWLVVQERPAPDSATRQYRLAVLPFANLSPDPANAFFADGMHDELLNSLVNRAPQLEVISRGTMVLYRDSREPLPQIARELEATHILSGSVRREAGMVRVTLQLVDAARDRQVWSRSFDRELDRVMTLQRELAEEVARQLVPRFAGSGGVPPPRNPEAYDLWLKGVLDWQQVSTGGATDREYDRVETIFTQAIEIDPTYAAAYADRSRIRVARFVSRADGRPENLADARADVDRALELAGDSTLVLMRAAQLAMLVDRDLDRSLRVIAEAERAGPLTPDLMMTKANFLMFAGRQESSLALHEQAARLDPGNAAIYRYWVYNLFAARRPRDAIAVIGEFDARFPGRLLRGEHVFAFTGSADRWRNELLRLRRDDDPNATLSPELDVLRFEGRTAETRERLAAAGDGFFPQHTSFGTRVGASLKPVAEARAWFALWTGGDARADGARLRDFVRTLRVDQTNDWWVLLLTAEAQLFSGDRSGAAASARQALAKDRGSTFAQALHIRMIAARVLAWAGEHEEAMNILDTLHQGYPAAGPALIAREPLFEMPLGREARWMQLKARLEAELAANQTLPID